MGHTQIKRTLTFWFLAVWVLLPGFVGLVLCLLLVKYPVVDEAPDTELLTQDRLLLNRWENSVFVCFLHRVHSYTNLLIGNTER